MRRCGGGAGKGLYVSLDVGSCDERSGKNLHFARTPTGAERKAPPRGLDACDVRGSKAGKQGRLWSRA
ncbi:hypothetical protein E2562_011455 [Oryza meyeriana var. granulata]|uniref:Uncharacterized protein n=1 Tax=Oryza meyeriana var. granulata TaxID=110450 RepID=A0A6G1D252_9ORYZ|nr:hypothetical protein E2562_011455 [Oryza meyeriana var. granulata]